MERFITLMLNTTLRQLAEMNPKARSAFKRAFRLYSNGDKAGAVAVLRVYC